MRLQNIAEEPVNHWHLRSSYRRGLLKKRKQKEEEKRPLEITKKEHPLINMWEKSQNIVIWKDPRDVRFKRMPRPRNFTEFEFNLPWTTQSSPCLRLNDFIILGEHKCNFLADGFPVKTFPPTIITWASTWALQCSFPSQCHQKTGGEKDRSTNFPPLHNVSPT